MAPRVNGCRETGKSSPVPEEAAPHGQQRGAAWAPPELRGCRDPAAPTFHGGARHTASPRLSPSLPRPRRPAFLPLLWKFRVFPGVGRETPTPTSRVCFEVGKKKNVWFLSPGNLPDSPGKLAGGHWGKRPRSRARAGAGHLRAARGTEDLEEPGAEQPGQPRRARRHRAQRACYITCGRGLDTTHSFRGQWFTVQLPNSDNLGWDFHSSPDYQLT